MTDDELSEWLDRRWQEAQRNSHDDDPEVDRFVDSTVLSIRYAFITQLVGKHAEPARDLLCLQKREGSEAEEGVQEDGGRWDPRSFCAKFIVPWVQRNQAVLGTSTDPYVNNPLRRPRLDSGMNSLMHRSEWQALVDFLGSLQQEGDKQSVERAVDRCLRSIARRLMRQSLEYPVPNRVSLDRLYSLLVDYLAESSHGLRPQVVATALFRVLGEAFGLFDNVAGQGLNEADAATGAPGDIICRNEDGSLVLAVEVKDRTLRLTDLRAAIRKARTSDLRNLLFTVPSVAASDEEAIRSSIADEWGKGINVYHLPIESLVHSVFVLLDESWRVRLLDAIGVELDSRGAPLDSRERWCALLEEP